MVSWPGNASFIGETEFRIGLKPLAAEASAVFAVLIGAVMAGPKLLVADCSPECSSWSRLDPDGRCKRLSDPGATKVGDENVSPSASDERRDDKDTAESPPGLWGRTTASKDAGCISTLATGSEDGDCGGWAAKTSSYTLMVVAAMAAKSTPAACERRWGE